MSDFELRTGKFRDLDQVAAIEKVAFPLRPYNKVHFAGFLLRARGGFVVACKDASVVGYVIAMPGRDGWIQSIAVLPDFRKKGAGEMLLKSAVEYLSGGSERVMLFVDTSNAAAIHLYRKLSFVETGKVVKGYYPNGGDAMEMARDLGAATGEEP